MALSVPDSIREAIGDKASIDLIHWANKSFEHNLDLRIKLTEERLKQDIGEHIQDIGKHMVALDSGLNQKVANVQVEIEKSANNITWKLLGFMTTQTALILGFMYFLHKT